jgi:hypothetical protein
MKTKEWLMTGAAALGMMIWTPLSARASEVAFDDEKEEVEERHDDDEDWEEEEHEVPFPSKKSTTAFLKKSLPLALELLERVQDEEGEDEYEEVLEQMREMHFEYLEIQEHDGREAAGLYLDGARLELELDHLLDRFHEQAETDRDREKVRKKIANVLRAQLERERKVMKLEVEMLKKHLREVKEELKEIEGLGDETIEERLNDLLDRDESDDEEEEVGEDEENDEEDEE